MDIGNGLKKLRKEKGITQIELGEKIGLSSQYISDVERGRNTPTDKTIKKILEPFNIKYVDFLIDYCGVKRVPSDEIAMQKVLDSANNKKDSTQQLFSQFVDISEIKGFELDGEPLSDKEQTALLSIIELIKSNKE